MPAPVAADRGPDGSLEGRRLAHPDAASRLQDPRVDRPDREKDRPRSWTAEDLCRIVEQCCKVSRSENGIFELSIRLELSWQKTRPEDPEADRRAWADFKKCPHPIAETATAGLEAARIEVWLQDMTRIGQTGSNCRPLRGLLIFPGFKKARSWFQEDRRPTGSRASAPVPGLLGRLPVGRRLPRGRCRLRPGPADRRGRRAANLPRPAQRPSGPRRARAARDG